MFKILTPLDLPSKHAYIPTNMEIMFIEPNVHAILSFELIAKSIYTKTIDNY